MKNSRKAMRLARREMEMFARLGFDAVVVKSDAPVRGESSIVYHRKALGTPPVKYDYIFDLRELAAFQAVCQDMERA